jgi:hypothetical protein
MLYRPTSMTPLEISFNYQEALKTPIHIQVGNGMRKQGYTITEQDTMIQH